MEVCFCSFIFSILGRILLDHWNERVLDRILFTDPMSSMGSKLISFGIYTCVCDINLCN